MRAALSERLRQVCEERVARLVPEDYGPHGWAVHSLQAQNSGAEARAYAGHLHQPAASSWSLWEGDCLEALVKLSLGESLAITEAPAAQPAEPFLQSLRAYRQKPEQHFRLLLERYSCPLNITLSSEDGVRERLLETLMVHDRARIEKGNRDEAAACDVLLKLNLLAIYAAVSDDLRYLDALNYYHEIPPEGWTRCEQSPWLYVSLLGLYRQALAAWLNQRLSE